MKKNLTLWIVLAFTTLIFLASCKPVSIYTQRATATAYSTSYMTTAMQAAENGAMALCNIDFNAGEQSYVDQICEASTTLGCTYFTDQISQAWADLKRAYTANVLKCTPSTSRFLEEGQQFGMRVQYWQVNLQGGQGWSEGNKNREYWLQVAEENSNWKLNRVLTSDEVAFYLAIDSMAANE
jgi:hypothetical protein